MNKRRYTLGNYLYVLNDVLFRGGLRAITANKKIKLLMYSDAYNFGDQLNRDLMCYLGVEYATAPRTIANTSCIGSVLDNFIIRNGERRYRNGETVSVFGSGFMHNADYGSGFTRNMKFYAVRGKLTKNKCEKIIGKKLENVTLGDPGLLIRRIFPNITTLKKYDVGIICHIHDKGDTIIQNIKLVGVSIRYIDVQQPTESFVREVAGCGFILSSAMHGLICADALGIPNRHIIMSDRVEGNNFKFRDYYSVFPNFSYHPVDLRETTITNRNIEEYRKEYSITSKEVSRICDELEAVFNRMKVAMERTRR